MSKIGYYDTTFNCNIFQGDSNSGSLTSFSSQTPPLRLNQCYRAATFSTSAPWLTARPSSNHGGVVVMGFGDGSVRTVREDVDDTVFIRLMTPNDKKSLYDKGVGALDLGNL